MKFEWDKSKAAKNLSKHEVSFDNAKTVFKDPFYVNFYDPDHSKDEDRYIAIGTSEQNQLIILSYTRRNGSIRLISARTVTRTERKIYEEG